MRGITYLTVVSVGTSLFGAVLVVLPGLTYAGFGAMVYGNGFPAEFGLEPASYIRLVHAVMGAVIAGWFAFVAWFTHTLLPRRIPGAWTALVLSVLLWFALDTSYSLISGFWQNAVLNTTFLAAFAPGFWLTRSLRQDASMAEPLQS